MQRTLSKWIYRVHLWVGLIAGLFAAALGVTGTVLIFRAELEEWSRPQLRSSAPATTATSIQPVIDSYKKGNPRSRVRAIQLPRPETTEPLVLMTTGASGKTARIYLDSATGRELQAPPTDWISWTVRLHHSLFLKGHFYPGLVGAALSLLCLSGIVVWWSTIRTVLHDIVFRPARLRSPRARDIHVFSGVWALIPVLVLAFSGTVFAWRDTYTRAALAITGSQLKKQTFTSSGDASNFNLDAALALARNRIPDATPTLIRMPAKSNDPVSIRMRTPSDSRQIGTTQVFLDGSGEVIGVEQPSDKPLAARAVEALAPLHTGELGGWPLRIAWAFVGLIPPVLFLSGVRATWRKYVRTYAARIPVASDNVVPAPSSDLSRKEAGI